MALFGKPDVEKLKKAGNVKGLIKALRYRKDGRIRSAAAGALGEMGDAQAVSPLIEALESAEDAGERLALIDALVEIGDSRAIDPLVALLKNAGSGVHIESARALERLGWEPTDTPAQIWLAMAQGEWNRVGCLWRSMPLKPLLLALHHPDKMVRREATDLLGEVGDPTVVPALIEALEDRDLFVSMKAADSLGQIGEPALESIGGGAARCRPEHAFSDCQSDGHHWCA